jgi:hypothetical protein
MERKEVRGSYSPRNGYIFCSSQFDRYSILREVGCYG